MIPAQRPGLLRSNASQQTEHNIRTQSGVLSGREQGCGLFGGQRLARPALLACGCVDQCGDIVQDVTVRLRMADGAGQCVVRNDDRPARVGRSQSGQGQAHIMGGELPQLDVAEVGDDRFENVAVEVDSLLGPAVEPFGQPITHHLVDGVAGDRLRARVVLGVQFPELGRDLRPRAPRRLFAAARSYRPGRTRRRRPRTSGPSPCPCRSIPRRARDAAV